MMNVNRTIALCALGLLGTYGCGNEEAGNGTNGANGSNGTAGNGSVDAGMEVDPPEMDAGNPVVTDMGVSMDSGVEPDAGQEPVCEAPTSGFGTREGRNFAPFAGVSYCDGTSFDFYAENDGFCDASLTVLIRAAEWCAPCRAEAQEIGRGILDEYGPLGVRFLTVMDQNQTGGAPSQAACSNWESSFGLDRDAIDHRMLIDPAQEVAVYFPPGQNGYPGNVIVNSEGQIVRRIIGFSAGLGSMKAALDELLGR